MMMTTTFIKNDIRSIELWTVKHGKKMQTLISYKSKKELILKNSLNSRIFGGSVNCIGYYQAISKTNLDNKKKGNWLR